MVSRHRRVANVHELQGRLFVEIDFAIRVNLRITLLTDSIADNHLALKDGAKDHYLGPVERFVHFVEQ